MILAPYLQSNGKTVLIDSTIWINIKDLQEKIDNDYCLNDGGKAYS